MANAAQALRQLESLKGEFGAPAADRKQACLNLLKSTRLRTAEQVERLHEALCFMQAWPDDEAILSTVDAMLAGFDKRTDLKRHVEELTNTGIAGTSICFQFYASTTLWLADRWPKELRIDWDEFENAGSLEPYLDLMASYSELPGLESVAMEVPDWIDRLKGPQETDACFVIRRLAALVSNELLHEFLCDQLDIPMILAPGAGVPSRTLAKRKTALIEYQTEPLVRSRPVVGEEVRRPLQPPVLVSPAEGARLVDLARGAMVTRERDLDAFAYADARDVSMMNDGSLQFVLYGVVPERRFLLETLYGYLILKNGVPICYGAATCLFNSAEVAYSILEPFRGADSARIFARTLAMIRQVFGCDTFMLVPYQLGYENDDAIKSGAWWFYQKLGFRPRDKKLLKLVERELSIMRQRPKHRSSIAVLKQLVTENMYLSLGEARDDVIGVLELANIGLKVTDLFASRFGADREQGEETLAAEAAEKLGVTSFNGWSAGEKIAWRRWAPLVALFDGFDRWPATDRDDLVKLIRAKGGRQELDYLRDFDGLDRLRSAVSALAEE
jgi:hypothetical protein